MYGLKKSTFPHMSPPLPSILDSNNILRWKKTRRNPPQKPQNPLINPAPRMLVVSAQTSGAGWLIMTVVQFHL